MVVKINREKILQYIIASAYISIIFLNSMSIVSGSTLLSITIALNILCMFKFKGDQPILICLIFFLTYWLYMVLYYYFDINYCSYSVYRTMEYTNATVRVVGCFLALLFLFLDPMDTPRVESLPKKNNPIIYVCCLVVMLGIVAYTFMVGGSFSYKEGNNSSLYEYYFIFALCAFCFGNGVWKKRWLMIVNAVYAIALLRLGLRLVVLQIALMVFIEYFDHKFKTRTVIFVAFLGFIFMSFWSVLRSGTMSLSIDLTTLLGVENNTLYTNQGDVFYTSSAQLAQVIEGKWDIGNRLYMFFAFLANIFLLPSMQLSGGKLNAVLEGMSINVPGGGFGSVYAYVWLGYLGVFFLAYYISHFIKQVGKNKSEFLNIYGVFLIFTFFRWNAYNLSIVFKMGFWLLLAYVIINTFDRTVRHRK